MKQQKVIMGMPIEIEIVEKDKTTDLFEKVFNYFTYIDATFSTYKKSSEISKINDGILSISNASSDVKTILCLAEKTKNETSGYFDITHQGKIDPSGIVKGWAILNASSILKEHGCKNFFIDAGGDIQVAGYSKEKKKWRVGIKNPFQMNEIIKIVFLSNEGIATSGTYIRGNHIYNPYKMNRPITDIKSITVIGPNIYEADRFATAAFAMGRKGIEFIESLKGFEGYMIDTAGIATYTKGFELYT